jgi:hypothetical protein
MTKEMQEKVRELLIRLHKDACVSTRMNPDMDLDKDNGLGLRVEMCLSSIRKELVQRVERLKKKRLREGNVLPNIGNFPINIHNDALDEAIKTIEDILR